MPRILDDSEKSLLLALRETFAVSNWADFRVGYFNLRGWKALDEQVDSWVSGEGKCCRLRVGMQRVLIAVNCGHN